MILFTVRGDIVLTACIAHTAACTALGVMIACTDTDMEEVTEVTEVTEAMVTIHGLTEVR